MHAEEVLDGGGMMMILMVMIMEIPRQLVLQSKGGAGSSGIDSRGGERYVHGEEVLEGGGMPWMRNFFVSLFCKAKGERWWY